MIRRRAPSACVALACAAIASIAIAAPACGGRPATVVVEQLRAPAAARGEPIRFAFQAIDGSPISTESLAGRTTVIGFITTYDVASQVEARHLSSLAKRHVPRLNVAALVLESPENKTLVEAFASATGLSYPVAIADAATIAGKGPFAGLHHVPSVVILDRDGREVWRHIGLVDEAGIEAALRSIEGPAK